MSAYQMASMHSKHSKQIQLPLGDRWGVPEGTSVADCLNWTWTPQPPPPPTPENQDLQLVVEEKTSNEVYVTPTTIDIDVGPTPAIPAESPVRRSGAPTPKHMAKTPSKCNNHTTRDWVMTNRQSMRAQTPTAREAIRTVTPAPTTVTRHYETSDPKQVPTSSFQRSFGKTVTQKKKEKATPPPLTFREYLQETGYPMVTGRAMTPVRGEKFGSYPHYRPTSHPDEVDYIVKQTRSLKMRPPTPARPASQNGFNSSLLVPRTDQDDAKEKAMIQAIRKELHSSRAEELDSRASQCIHGRTMSVQPRSLSRSQSRSQSRPQSRPQSQSRPRSSSQLELVREKKTVGFMDENEYYRYLTYLEDKYGGDSRGSSQAQHFNSWRGTTSQVMKKKPKATPHAWKSNGSESPGKVNVEMDCPENSDMTVSLRVRNTPTATVVY